ncbi:MAG: hypothetical protein ACYC8T_00975 [Myxococcaceae bacterium]
MNPVSEVVRRALWTLLFAAPAMAAPAAPEAAPAAAATPAPLRAPPVLINSTDPVDFTAQAKLLYRVVACAGDSPLPAGLDPKVVEKYCASQGRQMELYKKTWVAVAAPFIGALRPAGLPTTLVYPFGGGDLISALTTYPDARDITTMSLEHAGDPRRIGKVNKAELAGSLELIRKTVSGLLVANDSKTENLMKGQRGELPGQLSFFLIALAVHGYEPVSLRYFRVEPDGTLHYITARDIADLEKRNASLLHKSWVSPDFSVAFSNSELTFMKKGGDPREVRVHRHIAENLAEDHFGKDAGLRKYLENKGHIVAMTKAASYLLWRDNFATIRDYLLANMEFMISDSTGIPPRYAAKAGFVQETYGTFEVSFLGASQEHNSDFKKLWSSQPSRKLDFRYGYIDGKKNFHMLVTRKPPPRG